MQEWRVPGIALVALIGLLALAPAPAVAAGVKPVPAGHDTTSGVSSPVSAVQQELTPTRRRLPPVHESAADAGAARAQRPSAASLAPLALPTGVGPNVQLSPTTTTDRFSETAVAIDPNVTTGQNLAASSNFLTQTNHIAYTSSNNGTTWSATNLPFSSTLQQPVFFSDPGVVYDVGIAGNQHVFYSILGVGHNGFDVEVGRENTDGSFPSGVTVAASDFPDKPMIATDPRSGIGNVYVGFDTNPIAPGTGQPLMMAASQNSGNTWGNPVQVWNSGGDIGAWPAVAADGTVYVVWDDYCGATPSTVGTITSCPKPGGQILISKSTPGGANWQTTPTHIADTTTGFGSILPNYATECTQRCPARPVGPSPQIAIDRTGGARSGTIYVVYGDGSDRQLGASTVPSVHRMHIFLQASKDNGTTWSGPVRIDTGNLNGDSWEPSVAVDESNGNVVVAWYDRRDDSNNKLFRPYFTESMLDSGGLPQFSGQLAVADVQSDPTIDCNGSGDYLQIAAAGGFAHPVWTDTRTGLPAVFSSAITEATATTASAVSSVNGTLRDPHGTGWVGLPGAASDIGVGADCQTWVIGTNPVGGGGGVWAWEGPTVGWVSFPGGGVRITTSAFGLPRLTNNGNLIFRLLSNGSWQQLPGAAVDIGSGPDFSLWVIGTNPVGGGGGVFFFNGSGWTAVSGGGLRIAVGPDGFPWVINDTGAIFHLTSTGWLALPGAARDIGVGADGSAWVIGTNPTGGGFGIFRWNGSSWDAVAGGGVAISVGPDGLPWVVNQQGSIFERV